MGARLVPVAEQTVHVIRPTLLLIAGSVALLLLVASANAEKVQRVLFNLIQNAIRHTPADGSVTVRAYSAAGGVEVEVADNGEGIPVADGERVFEAFYRGDAARGEEGAGLGLAISRAIVEAHGGKIWFEDGAPGTRVHFTLKSA